ncbi:hypothetical protein GX50_06459 [[Emmonsia] crescens]|uniref:Probable aspartic-type endopeptidase OPSB n=1 Tax=[Emmonsia] crescens TaxID=73230 RepID=A0A2B7ZB28_9EURO|nr:hypothetical protein GX50_06459 [Emmonsia crescens]
MRGAATLCTLGTALLSALPVIDAIELVARDSPHVVGLEIQRKHVPNPIERDRLRKRAKVVSQILDNEKTLYFCNITLGTPEQRLRMHIDTGSSDLWCNTPNSTFCSQNDKPCNYAGTYDPSASSTYKIVSTDFNISYVDGSGALGDYVMDTLKMGSATLDGFQFGLGYQSSSAEGVLGIGYPINEVQVGRNGKPPYPNLPYALVDAGYINSPAYSLWLNDLQANTGSILFGGVDTEKFHGMLDTLPIIPTRTGIYAELVVALTGVSLDTKDGSRALGASNLPVPVLLDSGSSLCYLPNRLVAELYRTIRATYDPEIGAAFVPCRLMHEKAAVTFTFSKPAITVPMDELVLDLGPNPDGTRPTFSNGELACVFGISPAGDGISILGDTFLRSAYVVYDLDNNEISLARTNFNSTREQILEIAKGPDGVPSATGVDGAISTGDLSGTGGGPISGPSVTASTVSSAFAMPTAHPDIHLGALAGLAGAGVVYAMM